jgi:hypothetical protein
LAVANYHEEYGCLPPAYLTGPDGRPWHSWRVLLLPFFERDDLYKQYDFNEPWDGPNNAKLADRMPVIYTLDRDGQSANTVANYLAVVGPDTAWPGHSTITLKDVTDGTPNTILLVENEGAGVPWLEPRDLTLADMSLELNHPRGVSTKYDRPAVVTLDGSVRALEPTISPETLRALFTIRGGERVESGEGGWRLIPDGRLRPLRRE